MELASSGPTGEPDLEALERYILDRAEAFGPRPRVGRTVAIPLDESDCERARVALRRVSTDAPVTREIELAAVALEIELERPLACARARDRQVTLELDVADCVLLALALSYASRDSGIDAYRQQAESILDRVERSVTESVEIPADIGGPK